MDRNGHQTRGSVITCWAPVHYGSKQPNAETSNHSLSHEPGSEWASERKNEWVQQSARANWAGRNKRMSERCERTSERTSEWPRTHVPIHDCSKPQCRGLQAWPSVTSSGYVTHGVWRDVNDISCMAWFQLTLKSPKTGLRNSFAVIISDLTSRCDVKTISLGEWISISNANWKIRKRILTFTCHLIFNIKTCNGTRRKVIN